MRSPSPPDHNNTFQNNNGRMHHDISLDGFPFELLNREVDPIAAMHILDHGGEDINKFSSILADTINKQFNTDSLLEGRYII